LPLSILTAERSLLLTRIETTESVLLFVKQPSFPVLANDEMPLSVALSRRL
jgi:hypothetical protein